MQHGCVKLIRIALWLRQKMTNEQLYKRLHRLNWHRPSRLLMILSKSHLSCGGRLGDPERNRSQLAGWLYTRAGDDVDGGKKKTEAESSLAWSELKRWRMEQFVLDWSSRWIIKEAFVVLWNNNMANKAHRIDDVIVSTDECTETDGT